MYLHTRLGHGLGLTTRIGPLTGLFFLAPALMVNVAIAFYHFIAFMTMVVVWLVLFGRGVWWTYRACHPSPDQRRALVQPLLKEAVTACSRDVIKLQLKTYAVYAVRHRFFSGPFPATGARLAKLYPDEVADILIVGLFVDAPAARGVSTSLKRLSFSSGELRTLFDVKSNAPPRSVDIPESS